MKKTIKIIALCLSLTLFGVLFAGCDALDEMKAKHAVLSDDWNTITFRGETYKKLPHGAELYTSNFYGDKFENIAVTEDNVPVLVSGMFSQTNQYDAINDLFLLYGSYSEFYDYEYSAFTYYCNAKDYDKYINAIENGVLERIGFEYETTDDGYISFYYKLEVASESLSNEILGYINSPEKMTSETFDEVYNSYNSECLQCGMSKCDSEGLLAESLGNYDILRFDKAAYLVNYTTEVAVKLSEQTFDELKDVYFYGDYEYIDYSDNYTQDDASIGIIGGADGEEVVIVDSKLSDVNF